MKSTSTPALTAVILVAGRGTRLRELHHAPKCLLEIGGAALFDHYVRALDALGIPMVIVAGYRANDVRAHLDRLAPRTPATVVVNDRYELGSVVSLATGLASVTGGLLLLDGDVYFHPELLERMATGSAPNALLIDIGSEFTGEEYMAGVDGGRVMALRRARIDGHEASGEWVGFARLAEPAANRLRGAVDRQVAAGDTAGGYEDSLASILPDEPFRAVGTGGLPWVEIDFPGDVHRAGEIAGEIAGSFGTTAARGAKQ